MGSITRSFANLITANGPSAVADGSVTAGDISGNINFKNIIINGDMSVAQRGTSVAGISSGDTYNTVDRWNVQLSAAGTWTQSQDTNVPSGQGFAKSLKMACTTANASPAASSYLVVQGRFEGQNLQYLKKGTSSAESVTLSFWVKSNKTGTYAAEIRDADNSRHISKTYTINSADTWEKKTLTYAGDTTGNFDNDNAQSLRLLFWLVAGTDYSSGTLATSWQTQTHTGDAVGNVNLADSTSNYINFTGVQLEAGTTASDFEFLPYDINLTRCQRYFEKIDKSTTETVICLGQGIGSSQVFGRVYFATTKRVVPSGTISSASDFQVLNGSASAWSTASSVSIEAGDERTLRINLSGLSGMTTAGCHEVRINGGSGYIIYDAEL